MLKKLIIKWLGLDALQNVIQDRIKIPLINIKKQHELLLQQHITLQQNCNDLYEEYRVLLDLIVTSGVFDKKLLNKKLDVGFVEDIENYFKVYNGLKYHKKGDMSCEACITGLKYPYACECGGVIHAEYVKSLTLVGGLFTPVSYRQQCDTCKTVKNFYA